MAGGEAGGNGNTAGAAAAGAGAASAGTGGTEGNPIPLPPCGDALGLGAAQPLYTAADAQNPPVVTTLADGTLITRGAARVRGRHEKDPTFGEYDPIYFEDRSYGFIVEDFTPTGQDLIRTSYLPLAQPSSAQNLTTHWRAWKQQAEDNVFLMNDVMTQVAEPFQPADAPFAVVQIYETHSAPPGRSLAAGEVMEFEFGIFLDADATTTPNSRTTYYTDTFRYQIGVGGLTPNNADYPLAPGPIEQAQLGGATTDGWLLNEPQLYFDQMALNMQHENAQNFLLGRRLFRTDFTTGGHVPADSPDFLAQAGKVGPLMNSVSCVDCHSGNGAGEPLSGDLTLASSMVFRLQGSADLGAQLRLQQGTASAAPGPSKQIILGDGTVVTLTRSLFTVTPAGGSISGHSARVAPQLVGLGLLEAVDELTLLANADPLDCNQDGISGRPALVIDPSNDALRIGRMGWKAEKVGVRWQIAEDAALSLGVSTSLFPQGAEVELEDTQLQQIVTYVSLLGVPPQRDHDLPQVQQGQQLFESIGCSSCHLPQLVTSPNHPFAELRGQTIHPFTDLLLHDLGPDLADDSGVTTSDAADAPASASEWRTAPLWGIGLRETVNGHTALLHDGRAANVLEAALWHGGEAQPVIDELMALPQADRDALVAFVMSL